MPATLVIHSGTYKTGSTAIQGFLARAAARGRLPESVIYPEIGRHLSGAPHTNLFAQLVDGPGFSPEFGTWEDLVQLMRDRPDSTVVVSSEHLSTLGGEQIRRIGAYAERAGAQVRWIHYLRDQPSLYNAFYVERLMVMRPEFLPRLRRPFEEFRDWSPIDMGFLDYGRFLGQIRAAIPGVDLRARPMVRSMLHEGDVVADFCRTAGIEIDRGAVADANVGRGWRTVETARRLTRYVAQARLGDRLDGAPDKHVLRLRWIGLVRRELTVATTSLGWNTASANYLTPRFRDTLVAEYHADNLRVGKVGGERWADLVADTPAKEYNIGSFSTVRADRFRRVLDQVLPVLFTMPPEIDRRLQGRRAAAQSRPR
ncbi:hypothetical protein [Nocardioides insulae]|uniref:hypothetical protein n=1 Tax=Nocardioides insulae TaxID=394734 RepID=UPI0004111DDD|nr:hypothetical protein [Nocardioides insulae]